MKQTLFILFWLSSITGLTYADQHSWSVNTAFGMTHYNSVANQDSDTPVGRLGLGYDFFRNQRWQIGIETGIQSGSTLRLDIPKDEIDNLGGVPINVEIKPSLDMLLGLTVQPISTIPLVAWVKSGAIYRKLRTDRVEVNSLRAWSPEVQVGIGYRVNERATITLGYQAILSKQLELSVNSQTETAVLKNFPAQRALIFGVSFRFS